MPFICPPWHDLTSTARMEINISRQKQQHRMFLNTEVSNPLDWESLWNRPMGFRPIGSPCLGVPLIKEHKFMYIFPKYPWNIFQYFSSLSKSPGDTRNTNHKILEFLKIVKIICSKCSNPSSFNFEKFLLIAID